jgi:hypothetical protein
LTGYAPFHAVVLCSSIKNTSATSKDTMFNYRYNTSTFSNKEGAPDRTAQRKALIAKLHHEFNGELNKVQQHIADITHQCNKCGIYNDFVYIIKENSPPSHLDLTDPKVKVQWDQDPDRFHEFSWDKY